MDSRMQNPPMRSISPAAAFSVAAVFAAPVPGRQTRAAVSDEACLSHHPQDEVIYFVLPDRFENADPANDSGGLSGGHLAAGFGPIHKDFFHGGDIKDLTARLDYVEELGATAIWLGPIYKNKPVQGPPGNEPAGYHGYWITDFTTADPHFGSEDDLHALVEEAHARGIKVYLDIVTNHTADGIAAMARIYKGRKILRRGLQTLRFSETDGGVIAISRLGESGGEYLVVFNSGVMPRTLDIPVDPRSHAWNGVYGKCAGASSARGRRRIHIAPLDYRICKSNDWSAVQ